ncbi:hypothetical protein OG948_55880 (plasmid) [Embleya sp. NBC_00888]|uniref:hypothetical protein n=1 Tax=Embleya sp. NBC_00888 TaxID=2975960 RepID=UPI003864BF3E|nr:hypothetical protein OG948_55880 [Embleya sp. NBC_00888]
MGGVPAFGCVVAAAPVALFGVDHAQVDEVAQERGVAVGHEPHEEPLLDTGGVALAVLTELAIALGTSTRSGLGRSLSLLTGPDLTEVDEVRAWLDYHDAPITPGRIATVTVSVTLPENAIPGPVTVEPIGGSGLERTPAPAP